MKPSQLLLLPAGLAALLALWPWPKAPRHPTGHGGRPAAWALTPPPLAQMAQDTPPAPSVPAPAPGGQEPRVEADGTVVLTFQDLAASTRDAQDKHLFPESLKAADGKTARIRGFMVPYDSLEDMSVFMLMQVSNGCFFCDPPSLNQVVIVHQKPGGSKKFVEDPLEITGTFRVWSETSKHPDHASGFLYVLDDAQFVKVKIPNESFAPAKPDAHRPPAGR